MHKDKDYKNNNYINFLISRNVVIQENHFPKLDVNEQQLFENIIMLCINGSSVTVTKVMNDVKEFSPSTTHRRLKKLKLLGYIQLVEDELDNRVKNVYLSVMALTYIDLVNARMQEHLIHLIKN